MRTKYYIGLVTLFFATSASAQPLFVDGFESGNRSHTENGIRWTDPTRTSVNSVQPQAGSYALEFFYPAAADGQDSFSEQRFDLGGNFPEIWLKYDVYIPANYYHRRQAASANNKSIVTLWSGSYGASASDQFLGFEHWPSGDGNSRISIHPGPGRNDMGHTMTSALFVDRARDLGKWIEWIVHIKVASSANNDGVVQVWKRTEGYNRELVININDLNNYTSYNNLFTTGYLLGWSNSGFAEDTMLYIDNVVISREPIDIVVPNPPTSLMIQKN